MDKSVAEHLLHFQDRVFQKPVCSRKYFPELQARFWCYWRKM